VIKVEDIKLVHTVSDYGVVELKKVYPKYFAWGLMWAFILHISLISIYLVIQYLSKSSDDNIATVRIMKYSDLGPPPSISQNQMQQMAVTAPVAKPTVGVPVPVPDAKAPHDQTIATQQEMNQIAAPVGSGNGEESSVQITKDLQIDEEKDPDINSFVPVEKEPQIVKDVKPEYPDLARRAGVEGTVFIKILIQKDGKPKRVVVVKTDSDLFNQSAINAAMQFIFTPAIQDHVPVEVWVVVPFKFKLQ
jgi:periplasmic protein TonB